MVDSPCGIPDIQLQSRPRCSHSLREEGRQNIPSTVPWNRGMHLAHQTTIRRERQTLYQMGIFTGEEAGKLYVLTHTGALKVRRELQSESRRGEMGQGEVRYNPRRTRGACSWKEESRSGVIVQIQGGGRRLHAGPKCSSSNPRENIHQKRRRSRRNIWNHTRLQRMRSN